MTDNNLYTKYRPQTFADVCGQDTVKAVLKRIAASPGINCRSIFLKGSWGSGKCVAPDTIVRTDNGLRYAESLRGGEKFSIAMCDDGIHAVARNDNKQVYCIQTESGNVIRVTGNHPVMTWSNGFGFKFATEVRVGDILCRDVQACPIDFLFDPEAYFIGLLLGDGCCTKYCRYETYDKELFDRAKHCLDGVGATYTEHVYQRTAKRPMYWRIDVSKSCNFYKRLHNLGVIGHDAFSKDLPQGFFVCWSLSQQISLLQGVMDTDGSIDKSGSVDLTMAASKVVRGLAHVMHAMGIPTNISKKTIMYKGQTKEYTRLHSQSFPGAYTDLLCTLSYKRARILEATTLGQAKKQVFPGQADLIRNIIKDSGISFTRKQRRELPLNFNIKDEFTVFSALAWQEYLIAQDISCDVVLPNVLPDRVVSISVEEVDHTIDVQCETMPVFYTDGLVTHNTTLCRIFAKAMNCKEFAKTGDVCNDCDDCKEAESLTSQSYFEFDGSTLRDMESLENLKSRLQVPYNGRRVVVFDECHAADKKVQNGLLKVVEDGVPNTIFVFASTDDVINTIKSRSLCLDITTIPPALMKQRLQYVAGCENISLPDNIADTICQQSLGHMRDALSILQKYSISPEALRSSYGRFRQFMGTVFSPAPKFNPNQLLGELLLYPLTDLQISLNSLLRAILSETDADILKVMKARGIKPVDLFGFFYSPVAQSAVKSEPGFELLLRTFISKYGLQVQNK